MACTQYRKRLRSNALMTRSGRFSPNYRPRSPLPQARGLQPPRCAGGRPANARTGWAAHPLAQLPLATRRGDAGTGSGRDSVRPPATPCNPVRVPPAPRRLNLRDALRRNSGGSRGESDHNTSVEESPGAHRTFQTAHRRKPATLAPCSNSLASLRAPRS
jgi:hypothetical protein